MTTLGNWGEKDSAAAASSLTFDTPSGTAVGDALIVSIAANAPSGNAFTPPAGWTAIRDDWGTIGTSLVKTFARVVEDAGATYTFTLTGTARVLQGTIATVKDAAPIASWIVGAGKARTDAPASSTVNTLPSLATTSASTLVLGLSFERTTAAEAAVTVSGATQWFFSAQKDASRVMTIWFGSQTVPAAGASAPVDVTYPNAQATNGWGFQLAIPTADAPAAPVAPFTSISQLLSTVGGTMGHRGASKTPGMPEMSKRGYDYMIAQGYSIPEFSCNPTTDTPPTWVGVHDRTLNRTSETTGLGNIDQTMTWANVQTYENSLNDGGTAVPYIDLVDFLTTYADQIVMVDPKSGWNSPEDFLDVLDAHGGPERIIVKYVDPAATWIATPAKARGYKTAGFAYISNYTDVLTTYADAWDILGMEYDASQAIWDALKATGKPLVAHIMESQAHYDTAAARIGDHPWIAQVARPDLIAAVGPTPTVQPWDAIYVGSELATAVYVGAEQVWP